MPQIPILSGPGARLFYGSEMGGGEETKQKDFQSLQISPRMGSLRQGDVLSHFLPVFHRLESQVVSQRQTIVYIYNNKKG